jgi:hypothetical protein
VGTRRHPTGNLSDSTICDAPPGPHRARTDFFAVSSGDALDALGVSEGVDVVGSLAGAVGSLAGASVGAEGLLAGLSAGVLGVLPPPVGASAGAPGAPPVGASAGELGIPEGAVGDIGSAWART